MPYRAEYLSLGLAECHSELKPVLLPMCLIGTRRRRAGGADKATVDDDDPFSSGSAFDGSSARSPASTPSLKRALQASRVRASAALAKASR